MTFLMHLCANCKFCSEYSHDKVQAMNDTNSVARILEGYFAYNNSDACAIQWLYSMNNPISLVKYIYKSIVEIIVNPIYIRYWFFVHKNDEMLEIHTFALMKVVPSKFHRWGFSINFQLCLQQCMKH